MTSVLTADRWLYSKLTADATLTGLIAGRVYMDIAPEGATYPLIELQLVSGIPVTEVGASVIMWNELWQVKVIDKAESYTSKVEAIINQVRSVLHASSGLVTSGSAPGGTVIGCVETRQLRYTEFEDGVQYRHSVLEMRVYTQ